MRGGYNPFAYIHIVRSMTGAGGSGCLGRGNVLFQKRVSFCELTATKCASGVGGSYREVPLHYSAAIVSSPLTDSRR